MRGFVLVLFAAVPLFGGTLNTTVTCDGVTYEGSGDPSSTSCEITAGAGASAQASLTGMYVNATAWALYPGSGGADASLTGDYILTVTGGYGNGYAEPEFLIGASSLGNGGGEASVSLGGCWLQTVFVPPGPCPQTSVAFVFGVPQTLTLSEDAEADTLGSWAGTAPEVGGMVQLDGFSFITAYGQPLSGIAYTFVPGEATPEPGTLPLLTAMACAAFIAFKLRRGSPAC